MDGERLRILVVDDDEVDRMAVRRALRAGGIGSEVAEAEDVASALAALREGSFDCVLLDYQLPGGDGARVLREARTAGISVPMVMLTGLEDTRTAVELMKAGAADYLAKADLTPERLERSVRQTVRVHRAEMQTRTAEAALRDAEERVRLATESAEVGTWDFNPATGELRWSDRCKAAFGAPPEAEVDYSVFLSCLHPEDRARADAAVHAALSPGGPGEYDIEYRALWPDGTTRWIVAKGRAFFEGEGAARRAVRFLGTVLDISDRKRVEEERERALRSRDRFYAAMSHELRTPINAILGYNDLLLAGIYGPMAPAQEQGVERSQRAARHLLELVNDVLDLSKLEAGKMEVQVEDVEVPGLVEELFVTIRPLAAERGSELRVACAPETPRIRTDPRRVRQILLNLLSNAIKFGEGLPIEVRCGAGPAGGVVLEVADRGAGIAAGDIDRIFDEFVQLPSANPEGTGLGLPISRRLARLLGGSLDVDSEPGGGSTFRLLLPAVSPEGGEYAQAERDGVPFV